ncbi:MAG: rhodanese-like domain-containing protein [Oscillochloris sp.]|nr:rhodanese-like domain-containing protein [Oscillochloris sp.]
MRALKTFLLAALLLFTGACAAASPSASPQAAAPAGGYTTISVADLKARLDSGEPLVVLDVRTPEEFTGDGHVAGATLIPLPELGQRMAELDKDAPTACFCRSGNRSRSACDQLAQAGFSNLVNVDGGIIAWGTAGYPIER